MTEVTITFRGTKLRVTGYYYDGDFEVDGIFQDGETNLHTLLAECNGRHLIEIEELAAESAKSERDGDAIYEAYRDRLK